MDVVAWNHYCLAFDAVEEDEGPTTSSLCLLRTPCVFVDSILF